MAALTGRTALQVHAILAIMAVALAAAIMSLVLTQPDAAAAAIARHEYGTVAMAVAREVAGWVSALLRYL